MAAESAFHLPKSRGRFLISTPSRLVGELERPGLHVDHAFPDLLNMTEWQSQLSGGPYSRSYYVISTSVSNDEKDAMGQPVLKFHPQLITDLASVWFGKRFDPHGWTERHGSFWMPYGTELRPTRMSQLGPYNHQPRKDLGIALNWEQLSRPMTIFSFTGLGDAVGAFWKASSFYARAVRTYEEDPEVAFLHLICALEIIASQLDSTEEELFDQQTLDDFAAIQECVPNGEAVATRFRSRMFQLRRRVGLAAVQLTNDSFFSGSECAHGAFALTKDRLCDAVQAAYNVRSRYLHRGATFSIWLDPLPMQNEMQVGKPVLAESEEDLAKLLSKIPTFLGLERLVRFMLLRFAHLKITPLHEGLD